MGLTDELLAEGYRVEEVRFVGPDGHRVSGFSAEVFDRMTHGSFVSPPGRSRRQHLPPHRERGPRPDRRGRRVRFESG